MNHLVPIKNHLVRMMNNLVCLMNYEAHSDSHTVHDDLVIARFKSLGTCNKSFGAHHLVCGIDSEALGLNLSFQCLEWGHQGPNFSDENP